jgi:hypothetical protein
MTALRHTGGGLERFRGLDDRTGKVVPGLKEFAAYRAAWQGSGCQHGAPTHPSRIANPYVPPYRSPRSRLIRLPRCFG